MSDVELVIHTVPHQGEAPTVDGGELPPHRFRDIAAAKAAADEIPVPDGWQRREEIRDVATGIVLCWRTDRLPRWTTAGQDT
jgi:hypothetical protein